VGVASLAQAVVAQAACSLVLRCCFYAMTSEEKFDLQPTQLAFKAGSALSLWQGGMGPAGPSAPPILPSEVPSGESFAALVVTRTPSMRCSAEGSTGFCLSVVPFWLKLCHRRGDATERRRFRRQPTSSECALLVICCAAVTP
jgi:hypothetical protein